jgi:mxaJ protein
MFSLCRASFAALLAATVPALAQPLSICAEPNNLPYAAEGERGFEIEVARVLAADLGRELRVVYASQRTPDFIRSTINSGKCDALMSLPAQGGGPLATTRPWYRTGYAIVARDRVARLDPSKAIGMPSGVTTTALTL